MESVVDEEGAAVDDTVVVVVEVVADVVVLVNVDVLLGRGAQSGVRDRDDDEGVGVFFLFELSENISGKFVGEESLLASQFLDHSGTTQRSSVYVYILSPSFEGVYVCMYGNTRTGLGPFRFFSLCNENVRRKRKTRQ